MWVTNIVLETFHGMCFTCTGVSVCDDGRVVAFKNGDDTVLGGIVINKLLARTIIINVIESEVLPHAEMRIDIHVFLTLTFGNFSS